MRITLMLVIFLPGFSCSRSQPVPERPAPATPSAPAAGEREKAIPREEAPSTDPAALEKRMAALEAQLKELRKEMDTVEREAKQDKKPGFRRFVAALNLDPGQEAAVEEILLDGKKELLAILRRPLPDGTVMADELGEAFYVASRDPEKGQREMTAVYLRLAREKAPGTSKTYLQVFKELNLRISAKLTAEMNPEQKREYTVWDLDPLDVVIDDGPLVRYVEAYSNRKRQDEGK